VPDKRRLRLLQAAPLAGAIALSWGALETPPRVLAIGAAAASGLVLLLLTRVLWVALAAPVAIGVVACVAAGSMPRAVFWRLSDGLNEAVGTGSPFDPASQSALHDLVMVAVCALVVAVVVATAAGRPLVAGLVAVLGIGYPATLLGRHGLAFGMLGAACVVWPTMVSRARTGRAFAVGAAAVTIVVAGSATLAHAGLQPDQARVDWRGWSPIGGDRAGVGVSYVWDANYSGIRFPDKATVVLRVRAPRRLLYWRASTLDLFTDDRWVENLYPVLIAGGDRALPGDLLLRTATGEPLVKQEVEVAALDDDRLVAVSQPVRLKTSDVPRVIYLSGGVMFAPRGLQKGSRYTVWSNAPRPSPGALARSKPLYPTAAQRYLELGRSRLPAFGAPVRAQLVDAVFRDDRYPSLWPYRPLWKQAQRLTAASGSPYEATIAIESWLRATGGFGYAETPPAPPEGVPPLVDFATRSKLGYCQHYAGTMAVMLRLLGIPARVAVGFTSGRWSDGEWIVTDHQAHAWVEAWFDGYGWLPFDPTPGRGSLSADYTLASDSADAVRALGTGRFLQPDAVPTDPAPVAKVPTRQVEQGGRVPGWLVLGVSLVLLYCALIAAIKAVRRRRRLGAADPRAAASGIRLELIDLLRDHGLSIGHSTPLAVVGRHSKRELGVDLGALRRSIGEARYGRLEAAAIAAGVARLEFAQLVSALRDGLGTRAVLRATLRLRSLRGL
jgi:protein-glutamine gamma-glutamyltransferase